MLQSIPKEQLWFGKHQMHVGEPKKVKIILPLTCVCVSVFCFGLVTSVIITKVKGKKDKTNTYKVPLK